MIKKTLNNISDEQLIRAICEPVMFNLEINSMRGPDIDRLSENTFLRALTEANYINFDN